MNVAEIIFYTGIYILVTSVGGCISVKLSGEALEKPGEHEDQFFFGAYLVGLIIFLCILLFGGL